MKKIFNPCKPAISSLLLLMLYVFGYRIAYTATSQLFIC